MPVNEMYEITAPGSPETEYDRVEMNEQAQPDNQITDYRNCFNCFIILVMQRKEHDLPAFSPSGQNVSTELRLRRHGRGTSGKLRSGVCCHRAKALYHDTSAQVF